MSHRGVGLLGVAGASIVVFIMVAAALGIALVPAGLSALVAGMPETRAMSHSFGSAQTQAARSSLENGDGPALGFTPSVSLGSYQWSNLTSLVGTHPSARYLSAMTWDAADGYVLAYGGLFLNTSTSHFMGDTWTYLNGTWQNVTGSVIGSPPKLAGAALAYDWVEGAVILFGGALTNLAFSNVTYSYAHGVWTNITTTVGPAPSPRYATSMVWDSNDSELLLTGGLAVNDHPVPGTWLFKGARWSNITAASALPAILYTPNLADDPTDHGALASSIMSYSATGGAPFFPGTFLFSGGKWHNLTPTLALEPPMIYVGAMAYVSPTVGIFLVTGVLVNRSGDFQTGSVVWAYHGGAWSNITSTVGPGPSGDGAAGVTFDPVDQSILVVGGISLTSSRVVDQVWVLSAAPLASANASATVVDVGMPVTFNGNSSRGLSPITGAWTFGDGARAGTLQAIHTFSTAGVYTATFTATDSLGRSGSASVSVTVDALPTATISVDPATPTVGSPAVLVAEVSGGSPPLSYHWTLGDGNSSALSVVSHNYSKAQTYTVGLTVTDGSGKTATASASVVVGVASSSSSSGGGGSSGVDLSSGTGLFLLIGIVVLAAIAAVFALLWRRTPRSPSGAPTPYSGPSYPLAPPPPPTPPPGAA